MDTARRNDLAFLAVCMNLLAPGALLLSCPSAEAAGYIDACGNCRHEFRVGLTLGPGNAAACDAGTAPSFWSGDVAQCIIEQGWENDDPTGHYYAVLEMVRFDMEVVPPHPVFGEMTITWDPNRTGQSFTIRSVNPGSEFPYVHTTRMHVTAVAESLPGITLQNQGGPIEFIGEPSDKWPPTQNVYTLPVVVPFERRDAPGVVEITACPGDVSVSGSPFDPIPTLPEWGVIVLTLLLLTGGTVVFGQRCDPAAARGD